MIFIVAKQCHPRILIKVINPTYVSFFARDLLDVQRHDLSFYSRMPVFRILHLVKSSQSRRRQLDRVVSTYIVPLAAYYSRYPVIARLTSNYTSCVMTERFISYTCSFENPVTVHTICFVFFDTKRNPAKICLTPRSNERRNK